MIPNNVLGLIAKKSNLRTRNAFGATSRHLRALIPPSQVIYWHKYIHDQVHGLLLSTSPFMYKSEYESESRRSSNSPSGDMPYYARNNRGHKILRGANSNMIVNRRAGVSTLLATRNSLKNIMDASSSPNSPAGRIRRQILAWVAHMYGLVIERESSLRNVPYAIIYDGPYHGRLILYLEGRDPPNALRQPRLRRPKSDTKPRSPRVMPARPSSPVSLGRPVASTTWHPSQLSARARDDLMWLNWVRNQEFAREQKEMKKRKKRRTDFTDFSGSRPYW